MKLVWEGITFVFYLAGETLPIFGGFWVFKNEPRDILKVFWKPFEDHSEDIKYTCYNFFFIYWKGDEIKMRSGIISGDFYLLKISNDDDDDQNDIYFLNFVLYLACLRLIENWAFSNT